VKKRRKKQRSEQTRRSMASLKLVSLEIEKKRKAIQENQASFGSKYIKRGEIEKERLRVLQSQKLKKPVGTPNDDGEVDDQIKSVETSPALPLTEVIRRLRARNEPITLFGETALDREKRLRQLEAMAPEPELQKGQRNDFSTAMKEIEGELEVGDDEIAALSKSEDDLQDADDGVKKSDIDDDNEEEDKREEPKDGEKCREDICLHLFKKLIKEWQQELNCRPESVKRTATGKITTATFKQTRRYIRPLFALLRKRTLPDEMLGLIHNIAENVQKREYVRANDAYLRLAIGNAPWPIGVTMVGIHERSAREKIFTNQVAHILNDENQRKYIQSIKRLMTFAQGRYPTDPSKSVLN